LIITPEYQLHAILAPPVQIAIHDFFSFYEGLSAYNPPLMDELSKTIKQENERLLSLIYAKRKKINKLDDIRFFFKIKSEYQAVARILQDRFTEMKEIPFEELVNLLGVEIGDQHEAKEQAMKSIEWLNKQRVLTIKDVKGKKFIVEI